MEMEVTIRDGETGVIFDHNTLSGCIELGTNHDAMSEADYKQFLQRLVAFMKFYDVTMIDVITTI